VKLRLLVLGLSAIMAAVAGLVIAGILTPVRPAPPARPGASAPVPAGRCAATPDACGFPDATSTGVPAGTTLKTVPSQVSSGPGWTYDATQQVVQVTGNGAVLSGLYIPYTVNVKASNVTISKDKIVATGATSYGVSLRHTANVTVSDSTITGLNAGSGRLMVGVKDIYGDTSGTQILRDNIAWTGTGIQLDAGVIEGNYIHSPGYRPGDHVNGITSNGGTAPLLIRHNTIYIDRSQTDAIGLFEDFGAQANRTITGNLLAGGGYAIYCGQNRGGPPARNIVVTGNRISHRFFANGGYWGPATAFNPRGRGDTWAGNTWDGTGRTVPGP
jgi:hypothetical protein